MQTSVSLNLDKRRKRKDNSYTIVIVVNHFRKTTSISTGQAIPEEYWDESRKQVKSKYKGIASVAGLNRLIGKELADAQDIINKFHSRGTLQFLSINQLKETITNANKFDSFFEFGLQLEKDLRTANRSGTADSYKGLIGVLKTFTKGKDLKLNEVNYDFLKKYERYYLSKEGNSLNGLASYLRTLRAIFNKAIKAKLIDKEAYPFEDYKIRTAPTAKRAISTEYVKKILELSLESGSWPFHYRNYFLISYMLFGMSFIDMAFLKKGNIINGRIKFQRKKTAKAYDIKITQQLEKLLKFYLEGKKKEDFILPIISSHTLALQYEQVKGARKRYNRGLKHIAEECGIEDRLTSYVSRHSFATHAMLKEVPLQAISAMLGHNKLTTTQIYLKSLPSNILDAYQEQLNAL